MKSHVSISPRLKTALAVLVAGCAATFSTNSQVDTNSAAATSSATNLTSSQSIIPRSVFVVPKSPKEGKDPFFPDLAEGPVAQPTAKNPKATTSRIDELVLQGISGAGDARICVVNGINLAVGEKADVPTSTGRVPIRCLEINETNIVIELGGLQQELRFRSLK
jgi:hypothetical protein